MNNQYRYSLEPGSKKSICPACNKKRYVRYVDNQTRDYLPIRFGRCDRESKCAYSLNPYSERFNVENDFFISNPVERGQSGKVETKVYYIPKEILEHTYGGYEGNVFIQNLLNTVPFPFDVIDVEKVISLYHLGTIKERYRNGATTFPFIDIDTNIRTIQVKEFDEFNKTKKGGTDFLHSMIERYCKNAATIVPGWLMQYLKNDKKVSCLFGEHLLNIYPDNPIALVEAPKTAIYGTLYFGLPDNCNDYLWLAVYNLSSLNFDKCKSLKSRDVYLFPDLSYDGKSYELWAKRAKEIQIGLPNSRFIVSDILEKGATEEERSNGLDLADYLINQDWRKFTLKSNNIEEQSSEALSEKDVKNVALKTNNIFVENTQKTFVDSHHSIEWSKLSQEEVCGLERWNITEIEDYYQRTQLPLHPIRLGAHTITDVSLFVESHMSIVRRNSGNETYKPYLDRLVQLKKILGEWA
ncbi:MAG: DUF6371 domain-containing protein [Candidatus Marinimicrobia bacterium]|nr:DUF6371 domain-containing protein [Candidatus Neomarinimicrobiota bacterium]